MSEFALLSEVIDEIDAKLSLLRAGLDRLRDGDRAEQDALKALLKESEWVADEGWDDETVICWCCRSKQVKGHAPDCRLAAVIGKAAK